jgi:hypothetical protein
VVKLAPGGGFHGACPELVAVSPPASTAVRTVVDGTATVLDHWLTVDVLEPFAEDAAPRDVKECWGTRM